MPRRALPLLALLLTLLAGPASAEARHVAADAVALVNRAAAFLRSEPRAAALAAFNDSHGAFVDGDLYLYVLDATDGKLTMLAHGANHGLVGMAQDEIVDAEGRAFNDETVAVANSQGEGWITYKWPNPATRRIATKTSYVKLVDGVIIGAGIYQ